DRLQASSCPVDAAPTRRQDPSPACREQRLHQREVDDIVQHQQPTIMGAQPPGCPSCGVGETAGERSRGMQCQGEPSQAEGDRLGVLRIDPPDRRISDHSARGVTQYYFRLADTAATVDYPTDEFLTMTHSGVV